MSDIYSLASLVRSLPAPKPKPLFVCAPDVWEDVKRAADHREPPVMLEGSAALVDVVVTAWAPRGWWKIFDGDDAERLRGGNVSSLVSGWKR